jgi:ribosomal protein S18 acetylase RimI-like enzyme
MTFDVLVDFAHKLGVTNAQIADFYKNNWHRPIALSDPKFINWQFGVQSENHCVVAIADSKIIGIMAVTPRVFLYNSNSFNGAELSTWVVSSKARGLGIGKKILQLLQSTFQVLVGTGITDAAVPIYLSRGFSFFAYIPRYIYVSNFQKIKNLTKFDFEAERLTRSRRTKPPVHFVSKNSNASELSAISDAFTFIGFKRGGDYCQWRYEHHPLFNYEFYLITSESGDKAGIVLREDTNEDTGFIHLCDLFGDQQAILSAVCFLEQYAKSKGAAFIDATVTDGKTIAAFRQRGWISAVDDNYVQIPSLFYPLEIRTPATTSLIFWATDNVPCAFDLSTMSLTKGDLDLDRPTLDFYENIGLK